MPLPSWPRPGWQGALLLPIVMAWIPPALAETVSDATMDLTSEMVRIVGYLAVVVALSILAVRLSRRFEPRWHGGAVRLLGSRTLAPGVGVRLIQVGSRAWLLGVTREQVSLLAELKEQDLPVVEERRQ
ncbi:MAG: flagellar biosynthetic protein FliO [Magnetococcales bacterium]|nr:flagellar biosynthetic protein FliO [Magnetococcales bacterium]